MHSGDLDGLGQRITKRSWRATVTLTVHDQNHQPVSGVTVSGIWDGGYSSFTSCVTGPNGACSMTTGAIANRSTSVLFVMFDLSGNGMAYDFLADHDDEGDCLPGYPSEAIEVRKP